MSCPNSDVAGDRVGDCVVDAGSVVGEARRLFRLAADFVVVFLRDPRKRENAKFMTNRRCRRRQQSTTGKDKHPTINQPPQDTKKHFSQGQGADCSSETLSCATRIPRPWRDRGARSRLGGRRDLGNASRGLETPADDNQPTWSALSRRSGQTRGEAKILEGEKAGKLGDLEGARKLGHNCGPQLFRRWAVTFGVQKPIFCSRLATKHTPRWWV